MGLSSLVWAGEMPQWMLERPSSALNSVLEVNTSEEKSRSSALQAPLPVTKTEPLLSLEVSVHVHSCCDASAYALLLPEEGTVCLVSGSRESPMSYFEAAWFVPLILSGACWDVMVKAGQRFSRASRLSEGDLLSCSLPRGGCVEQISEVLEDHAACWRCKTRGHRHCLHEVGARNDHNLKDVWPVGHMISIVFF